MSELTIEQKVKLLEKILGYEQKLPEVDMTIAPVKWHVILRSWAVLISKPFQLPNVGGKFDGWYDYSYDTFKPEENLVQAIMLLDGLRSVSGLSWKITFQNEGSPYSLQDNRLLDGYLRFGNDLCELIVNACLWWLENKVEE